MNIIRKESFFISVNVVLENVVGCKEDVHASVIQKRFKDLLSILSLGER
jgi:hypothetical protein